MFALLLKSARHGAKGDVVGFPGTQWQDRLADAIKPSGQAQFEAALAEVVDAAFRYETLPQYVEPRDDWDEFEDGALDSNPEWDDALGDLIDSLKKLRAAIRAFDDRDARSVALEIAEPYLSRYYGLT